MRVWIVSFLLFGCSFAIAAAPKGPRITFENNDVVVEITPGAKTVLVSMAREWDGRNVTLVKRALLLSDDDRDGKVRFANPGPIPLKSFWVSFDVSSGEYAIVAPDGWTVARKPIPPSAFMSRGNAREGLLAEERDAFVVVARPGVGAWVGRITDGLVGDDDATVDGRTVAALESLTPVGSTPGGISDFRRDDVVLYADVLEMTIHEGRVVK
jgi:hypothetical protein